jgi:hypothetical protein
MRFAVETLASLRQKLLDRFARWSAIAPYPPHTTTVLRIHAAHNRTTWLDPRRELQHSLFRSPRAFTTVTI